MSVNYKYHNAFSRKQKIRRLMWNIFECLVFRPTPPRLKPFIGGEIGYYEYGGLTHTILLYSFLL